jgi:phosphinothricin acetyltransferase
MRIRQAVMTDAVAVQALYAPFVRETVISFEYEPPSVFEMGERIVRSEGLLPWLVCESDDARLIGYAYASKHRERAAYQWSVDVSVYVSPASHRMGVGRRLYSVLFNLLRLQGYVNAYAGITLPNNASVGLHRALGFEPVGVYRNVGYKFGGWHDVGWWALALLARPTEPTPPLPMNALDPEIVRVAGLSQ